MKIANALIELLAIKLYEHDHQGKWPVKDGGNPSWMALPDEDRQIYRDLASGKEDLP